VAGPPNLSLWQLFLVFLGFGLRAWGGPVVQIAMIRQQLVAKERWISPERFNRVLAVYQVLPGPEATELCCYFGMLARGRLGSVLAGLGFILPGFVLLLLLSWAYDEWGLRQAAVQRSFTAVQAIVAAMVVRAVHTIGRHAVEQGGNPGGAANAGAHKSVSHTLFALVMLSALLTVLKVTFFATLLFCGVLEWIATELPPRRALLFAGLWLCAGFAAFAGVVASTGWPDEESFGAGATSGRGLGHVFLLGLLGGLLTFGGAYTAVPFIRQGAVVDGGWMSAAEFLDGLALAAVLPTPLIMFSTFVGFRGHGVAGALLMTVGVFLPAFSFTLIGHNVMERVVDHRGIVRFLDGVTAAVVGLIAITAAQIAREAITSPLHAVTFGVALAVLYNLKHPLAPVTVVLGGAIAGQALFEGDSGGGS
jgi:chromate transporter